MNQFYQNVFEHARGWVDEKALTHRRILVTGANGLIGSHMVYCIQQALSAAKSDCDLTLISRSPAPEWMRESLRVGGTKVIQADLSGELPLELLGKPYDLVVHAATYGQPKKFLDHSIETLRLNANLTEHLLSKLVKPGGRFLFMSSSEIYGSPPPEFCPLAESFPGFSSPVEPRAVYTSSKRYGETLTKVYSEKLGFAGRIARVSSVYGPGVRWNDDRAINVFIRRALKTGHLSLQDPGLQVRRWLDIGDAMRMLFFILLKSDQMVYNVAGDDLRSIEDLARLIAEETGCSLSIPEDTQSSYVTSGSPTLIDLDIELIRKSAQLPPLRRLRDIVASSVAWHRTLIEAGEGANGI